jgi:hypothetical protein
MRKFLSNEVVMESWSHIVKYYEDLAQDEKWKEFVEMEKLAKNLIANRNLNELHAHTTHMILGITKSEKYEHWINEPKLFIELNFGASDEYLYKFSFIEPVESNEIIRTREEVILCSFEKSLEVFDEMVEKLKAVSK